MTIDAAAALKPPAAYDVAPNVPYLEVGVDLGLDDLDLNDFVLVTGVLSGVELGGEVTLLLELISTDVSFETTSENAVKIFLLGILENLVFLSCENIDISSSAGTFI
jgi:hypothetical protein